MTKNEIIARFFGGDEIVFTEGFLLSSSIWDQYEIYHDISEMGANDEINEFWFLHHKGDIYDGYDMPICKELAEHLRDKHHIEIKERLRKTSV